MAAKRILITGANTGIGFATAELLVQSGADVILACRNPAKAADAQAKLQALGGTGKVELISLDLNSLDSVKAAADEIIARYGYIDVLINNAGLVADTLQQTADGYEQSFGVNYVGPFLFTQLLLSTLKKAEAGRIIHLASIMHWLGRIKPSSFRQTTGRYNSIGAYGQSKLANLLFSHALAKQLAGTNVTSNALHPGGVDSEIYRDLPKGQYQVLKHMLIPTSVPAKLIADMAISPEWAGRNDQYVSAQMPPWQSPSAKNKKLADDLYQQSLDLVKAYL